jgi:hypothetical protein
MTVSAGPTRPETSYHPALNEQLATAHDLGARKVLRPRSSVHLININEYRYTA